MKWRLLVATVSLLALMAGLAACRGVLGLGEPLPYETEAGAELPDDVPEETADGSACGADLVTDVEDCDGGR